MRPLIVIFSFALLLSYSLGTKAQLIYGLQKKQNAFAGTLGVYGKEPILTFTYAHCFHIKLTKKLQDDVTLFVDFTDRSNLTFENDFRFTYGGQGYLFEHHRFKLLFRKTFTLNRYTFHELKATYLGGELELMPGCYTDKFFIAADFYLGDSFAGHVVQPNHFLQNVTIGWGHPHLLNFRSGINAGWHFESGLTPYIHFDYAFKLPHDKMNTVRWFALAGVSYTFGKAAAPPLREQGL